MAEAASLTDAKDLARKSDAAFARQPPWNDHSGFHPAAFPFSRARAWNDHSSFHPAAFPFSRAT